MKGGGKTVAIKVSTLVENSAKKWKFAAFGALAGAAAMCVHDSIKTKKDKN